MESISDVSLRWYELFSNYAADLYPGRYTMEKCRELARQAVEIKSLARKEGSHWTVKQFAY